MRKLLVPAVALLLAGCAAPRIDASRYAVDYNRAVATEANETMLLNIVRARHRDPTHYTSTSAITAQLTAERSGNIGGSVTGATRSVVDGIEAVSGGTETQTDTVTSGREVFGGSAGLTLKYSQQPTFSIQVNNTPEFTRGTSSPITASMFANLIGQGYRSDMLIAVLVESLVISTSEGDRPLLVANPNAEAYKDEPCDANLFRLVQSTLRYRIGDAERAPTLATIAATPEAIAGLADLLANGYALRVPSGQDAGDGGAALPAPMRMLELYQTGSGGGARLVPYVKEEEGGEFDAFIEQVTDCLPQNATQEAQMMQLQAVESTSANLDDLKIGLSLRSVDGAVYAMGEYLRRFEDCFLLDPAAEFDAETSNPCTGEVMIGEDSLLRIRRASQDADPGYSPAFTSYAGNRWIVPREDGHRTMQVVDMLQKLTNLNRSADELRTPAFIQVN